MGTKTSSFGSAGREGHDSTAFYNRRLYATEVTDTPPDPQPSGLSIGGSLERVDWIACSSSEYMTELPDESVHLMVTSPPYNVGKEYDKDHSLIEYLVLLCNVWTETYRVLVPGGRACINIANLGRSPYIPLHSYVITAMTEIGFLMRGEIIWAKGASAGSSTAWGSWMSPSNPVLRDVHEYILVFSKGKFKLPGDKSKATITRDDFLALTKSIWEMKTESAKRVGHPAPFPIELPRRLIELYTYEGNVILDPFIGSGSTALAAIQTNRHYVGYDTNQDYVDLASERIQQALIEGGKK